MSKLPDRRRQKASLSTRASQPSVAPALPTASSTRGIIPVCDAMAWRQRLPAAATTKSFGAKPSHHMFTTTPQTADGLILAVMGGGHQAKSEQIWSIRCPSIKRHESAL